MGPLCINTSSKEFKETAARLNLHEDTLHGVIQKYVNQVGDVEAFPTDYIIQRMLTPKSFSCKDQATYDAMVESYKKANDAASLNVFTTAEAAANQVKMLVDFELLPEDSYLVWQAANGYYYIKVAEPVMASSNEHTDAQQTKKSFNYTQGQQEAVAGAIQHINDTLQGKKKGNDRFIVIEGKAGTGKTTIVPDIVKGIKGGRFSRPKIAAAALSDKATAVIGGKMDHLKKEGMDTDVYTIAGLLGLKQDRDKKTGREIYVPIQGKTPPINYKSVIFIDEASMIGEKEWNMLMKAVEGKNVSIVFIGDRGQLPPVRDVREPEYANFNRKQLQALSPVFTSGLKTYTLTERVRQGEQSPILEYSDRYHNYSQGKTDEYPVDVDTESIVNDSGALIVQPHDVDLLQQLLPLFLEAKRTKNMNLVKLVAYTVNDEYRESAVTAWNRKIRKALYPDAKPEDGFFEGDLVIFNKGYKIFGSDQGIKNATEGIVTETSISDEAYDCLTVPEGVTLEPIKRQLVTIKSKDMSGREITYTVPIVVNSKENKAAYERNLAKLKKCVNSKADWSNIYYRYVDWANAELGFAYAIGAHKSQGSTYQVTAVDVTDVNRVTKTTLKDKATAMYTAVTRSSNITIISSDTANASDVYTDIQSINDRINAAKEGTATGEFHPETEPYFGVAVTKEEALKRVKFIHYKSDEESEEESKGGNPTNAMNNMDDTPDDAVTLSHTDSASPLEHEGETIVSFASLKKGKPTPIVDKPAPKKLDSVEAVAKEFRAQQDSLNSHIKFIEDGHIYKVDGKTTDLSVTGLKYYLEHGQKEKKKISTLLEIASRVGNTHDTILRDYFMGKIKDTSEYSNYANVTEEQFVEILKQGKRLKDVLQSQFGEKAIFITDEKYLRVAGKLNVRGTELTIAGTMDMIVIGEDKKIHVVDFKTSRSNNHEEMSDENQEKYSFQLALYQELLKTNPAFKDLVHEDAYLAQFNVKYEDPSEAAYTFEDKQVKVNGQKIQESEKYSSGVLHDVFSPEKTDLSVQPMTINALLTPMQQASAGKSVQQKTDTSTTTKTVTIDFNVPFTRALMPSFSAKFKVKSKSGKETEYSSVYAYVNHAMIMTKLLVHKKKDGSFDLSPEEVSKLNKLAYRVANAKNAAAVTAIMKEAEFKLSPLEARAWKDRITGSIKKAYKALFEANPKYKDSLLKTGSAEIIYPDIHDSKWPVAEALMELRGELGGTGITKAVKEEMQKAEGAIAAATEAIEAGGGTATNDAVTTELLRTLKEMQETNKQLVQELAALKGGKTTETTSVTDNAAATPTPIETEEKENEDAEKKAEGTKLVDANGKPLVVYHGSNYEKDAAMSGDWSKNMLPYATYFAPYKYKDSRYPYYQKAYLNIKNPLYVHPDFTEDAIQDEDFFKREVIDKGYDAVIACDNPKDGDTTYSYIAPEDIREIIVVNPNQVIPITEADDNVTKVDPNAPTLSGKMTYDYGKNKRGDVKSSTTFEAIKSGERKSTTRFTKHGKISYWQQAKVGSIITFNDGKGNEVKVKVTKPLTKLTEDTNAEEWSKKEGWSVDYFNKEVLPEIKKGEAYQIEYELLNEEENKEAKEKELQKQIEENKKEQEKAVAAIARTRKQDAAKQAEERKAKLEKFSDDFFGISQMTETPTGLTAGYVLSLNDTRKAYQDADGNIIEAYNDITPRGEFDPKKAILDSLSKCLEFSSRVVLNGYMVNQNLLHTISLLKNNSSLYLDGFTETIPLDPESPLGIMAKEYLREDPTYPYNPETGELKIPAFTVGFTRQEIEERNMMDKLVNSGVLKVDELRNLAKGAIYKASEILTHLNSAKNANEIYFGTKDNPYKDVDFTTMSRIQVIQKIGIGNLLNLVRDRVFLPSKDDKRSLAKKKKVIRDNWEAFRTLGYDTLIGLEAISLGGNENVSTDRDTLWEGKSEDEIQELFGTSIEHWQVGFRQVSAFSSLSQMIKRKIDSLYEVDENGNIVFDEFGMGKHLNPQEVVSKMLAYTQGAKDINQMIKLLKDRADDEKWLNQIIELLEGPKADEQFVSQFYTNFRKYFQKYAVITEEESIDPKTHKKVTTTRMKVINESQYADIAIAECKSRESSFAMGGFKLKNKDGSLNKETLEKLTEAKKTIMKLDAKILTSGKKIQVNLTDEELKQYHDTIKEVLDLLDIDAPADESLFRIFGVKGNYKNFRDRLTYLVRDVAETIKKGKMVTDMEEYKNIVKIATKEEGLEMESVSYEAGKMYYSYVLPSYLGNLVGKLKQDNMTDAEFDEFIKNEYTRFPWFKTPDADGKKGKVRCYWLDRIMHSKTLRQNMEHTTQLHFKGTQYTDKSPAGYIASMMRMYFYDDKKKWAYFRMPMMSNKPSEEYLKFERITSDPVRGSFKDFIINKLHDTFFQELDRIQAVRERNGFCEGIPSIQKHQKIKNFDTNGLTFCFLNFLPVESVVVDTKDGQRQKFVPTIDKEDENYDKAVKFCELIEKKLAGEMGNEGNDDADLLELFEDFAREGIEANYQVAKKQWIAEGFMTEQKVYDSKGEYVETKTKFYDGMKLTEDELQEFYWNDMFASINILELTIDDTAYYADTEDLQKRLAQLHAPGTRANINATYHGEKYTADGISRTIYLQDDEIKAEITPNLEKAFDILIADAHSEEEKANLEAQKKDILGAFKKVNVADAQGYSCPTSFRKKMGIFGKWGEREQHAYEIVTNPEKYPDENIADYIDVLWQPIKPFIYTQVAKEGYNQTLPTLKVGIQNKNSEYTLIIADAIMKAAGNRANKLAAIYDFMEESQLGPEDSDGIRHPNGKGIDTVQFMSTVKAGRSGVIDLNDERNEDGSLKRRLTNEEVRARLAVAIKQTGEYDLDYVHEIPFEDYMIQNEVPAHFRDHSQAHGSQDRILTFADMPDYEMINGHKHTNYLTVNGERVTVAEAKERYFKAIADNIEDSKKKIFKRFNLENADQRTRNVALSRILKDTILKDARFGSDLLWACDTNEYGEFNIPLSDPIQSNRIQQLLNSIIKNEINKQEIAGGPVVQVSEWGLSDELHIRFKDADDNLLLTEEEFNNDIRPKDHWKYRPKQEGQTYKEYISEQAGVAYFEAYAPIQDADILKDFLLPDGSIDVEAMEEENPKLLEMVGYRIPTESKYSMAPIKIKGFLPRTGGEGLMLPAEITSLAGSDFDIDKEYIMRYQLIRNPKTGKWEEPKKGTREYNDNLIISTQLAVLRSEQVQQQLFTPGNFEVPKLNGYLIAYVQTKAMETGKSAREVWDEAQAKRKELGSDREFTDWLKKNNKTTSNLIFNQTQVQFHKQNMTAGKLIGIFAQANVSHAFVSLESKGEMDDPALLIPAENSFRFDNINVTGNFKVDELRTKDGKVMISNNIAAHLAASVDAVKDPILNLININSDTANLVTSFLRMGFRIEQVALFCAQPIVKELITDFAIASATKRVKFSKMLAEKIQKLKEQLPNMENVDIQVSSDDLIDNLDGHDPEVDYMVLNIFARMQGINDCFSDMTHMTRYNSITAAVGPFASDTMLQRTKDRAFEANDMINATAKRACRDNPILKAFRTSADICEKAILGANLIQASQHVDDCLKEIAAKLDYKKGVPKDLASAFSDFYMAYYVQAAQTGPMYDLSKEHRLEVLRDFPDHFRQLKTMFPDNLLINSIQRVELKTEEFPVLQLKTRGMSSEAVEDLKQAWAALYEQGGTARDLAEALIEYNFFRNGYGYSPKTFIQLVPNSIKERAMTDYINVLNSKNSKLVESIGVHTEITQRMLNQFILHHPDYIPFRGKSLEGFNPADAGDGRITVTHTIFEDGKFMGSIESNAGSFIRIGSDVYFVEEHTTTGMTLRKLNKLGGDGQGIEIDLDNDYPESIYSQKTKKSSGKSEEAEPGTMKVDTAALKTILAHLSIEEINDLGPLTVIESISVINERFKDELVKPISKNVEMQQKLMPLLVEAAAFKTQQDINDAFAGADKDIKDINPC